MNEFTVKISGKQAGEEVSVQHAPLKEIKETLEALYALIAHTSDSSEPASVSFRDGSLAVVAQLPPQTGSYLAEVMRQPQHNADEEYANFIGKLAKSSRISGLDFSVLQDDVEVVQITPHGGAELRVREPRWVTTTLTMTGRILNMGGRRPNIHVESEHSGETYIVSIDQKTIQELRLYQRYVFDVQAEQAFDDASKLRNMKYRSHLLLAKRMSIEELIALEAPKWADVADPDAWVAMLRGNSDLS